MRLFRCLSLGEIAGNFRESFERSAVVSHRGNDDVGPKLGAVLANPPVFVFKASVRDARCNSRCEETRSR